MLLTPSLVATHGLSLYQGHSGHHSIKAITDVTGLSRTSHISTSQTPQYQPINGHHSIKADMDITVIKVIMGFRIRHSVKTVIDITVIKPVMVITDTSRTVQYHGITDITVIKAPTGLHK
jgi:hypothetical protein